MHVRALQYFHNYILLRWLFGLVYINLKIVNINLNV